MVLWCQTARYFYNPINIKGLLLWIFDFQPAAKASSIAVICVLTLTFPRLASDDDMYSTAKRPMDWTLMAHPSPRFCHNQAAPMLPNVTLPAALKGKT